MNKLTIFGRITADPIVRKVPVKGVETSVCNFYVAVNDGFGNYQKTDFFHVTAWRGAADAIGQYMKKGRQIMVHGAVHLETYTTKNAEGKDEQRTCMSITRVEDFEFADRRVPNETTDDDPPFEE